MLYLFTLPYSMQYFFRLTALSLIFSLTFGMPLRAEPARNANVSVYRYPAGSNSVRSVYLPPLLSGLIPGFDQWIEGQYDYALGYTLIGAGGLLLYKAGSENVDSRYKNFGLQVYLSAGAMSLFHSFRSAVNSSRFGQDFKFIKRDEPPSALYTSAFRFKYMERWTTLLPILSSMALYFLVDTKTGTKLPAEFGDFFYAGSTSYMTGVSEELVFRGYLMPVLYNATGSELISNIVQGGAFGLAHGLRFKHFISATIFGLYAGWIVQRQDWELGEMIFVHTWIDLMAFLADYANHREPSSFSIPLVMTRF